MDAAVAVAAAGGRGEGLEDGRRCPRSAARTNCRRQRRGRKDRHLDSSRSRCRWSRRPCDGIGTCRRLRRPSRSRCPARSCPGAGRAGTEAGEPVDEELLDESADEIVEVPRAKAAERRRRPVADVADAAVAVAATDDLREGVAEGARRRSRRNRRSRRPAEPAALPARPNQFGSVWDSQIGMAGRPARLAPISRPRKTTSPNRRSPSTFWPNDASGSGGRARVVVVARVAVAALAARTPLPWRRALRRSSAPRYSEPVRQPQAQPPRRRDERPPRQAQPVQQRGGHRRGGGAPRSTGRDSSRAVDRGSAGARGDSPSPALDEAGPPDRSGCGSRNTARLHRNRPSRKRPSRRLRPGEADVARSRLRLSRSKPPKR